MESLGGFLIGALPETAQVSAGVRTTESSGFGLGVKDYISGDNSARDFGTDHISFSQQTSTHRPKHVLEARTKNDKA